MTATYIVSNHEAGTAAEHLQVLAGRLDGELITGEDSRYEEMRRVHSVLVDRRPLAVVRAATPRDVCEAVRFGTEHGYPLTVRSGGHSLAGHSVADGALLIDLSAMRGVAIDPARRTARVQPGVTSGQLMEQAHPHGLALSTGDTASVGVGGLATGGGIGWMVRKYGLTIDNLLSAEVVTADGRITRASATERADLFWAIRGGGGNFGIVTEFEFRLAPVDLILGGALVLPATREVLRAYLDYAPVAPEGLTTIATVMHAPPAPFMPAEAVGRLVLAILACWTGDLEEGQTALAPLRAAATPIADTVAAIPYPAMYRYTAGGERPHASAGRSMFASQLSDASIEAILSAMEQCTSPTSMVQLRGLGGAVTRVGRTETAFAHRDKQYMATVIGSWHGADEDAAPHRAWVTSLWEQIRLDADGVYANFLEDEGDERVHEAYPEPTFSRLVEIKQRYDPANVFRFNQNIAPRS
jgi:hypothetical protein